MTTPTIGSRWEIRNPNNHHIYELEAIDSERDPLYCYRLRLVEIKRTKSIGFEVGVDTIDVELAWFSVRQDVRRVS